MRKWMRERMKRGKKPSENVSESTGKIGQAIDPLKPAPLMPSYDSSESAPRSSHVEKSAGHDDAGADTADASPPRSQGERPSERHQQHSDRHPHSQQCNTSGP